MEKPKVIAACATCLYWAPDHGCCNSVAKQLRDEIQADGSCFQHNTEPLVFDVVPRDKK